MGFESRLPNPNDSGRLKNNNPWGPKGMTRDDVSVLLGGEGKRCSECKRVILNEYLQEKNGQFFCPDCLDQI